MGYGVYKRDGRWAGYGVPATCDHPDCGASIDRGLAYMCAPDTGCGLFFCSGHLVFVDIPSEAQLCERCRDGKPPFDPTPDTAEWVTHMLTDESWQTWRDENPAALRALGEQS